MKKTLTRILFGSAVLALLACQAMAEGKISGITTKPVGDGLQVQIKGEELTAPRILRVMGGRSFMLEFDASLTSNPQWIRVEQGGVHYVQSVVYQTEPPKIRIYLRVDPTSKLETNANSEGFAVKVTPGQSNANPVIKQATPIVPAATTTPVSEKIYRPNHELTQVPSIKVPPTTVTPIAAGSGQRLVSLDFVNTDLVQILKALSLEAGVNIVASPEVKGTLTVSLGNVRVTEALDLITTLAGVRYAQIGNTYVVTSPGRLTPTVGSITHNHVAAVTKIVPLYSGEGTHIKGALAPQNPDVQFLLPSEKPVVLPVPGSDADSQAKADQAAKMASAAAPQTAQTQQSAGASPNNTGAVSPKDAYLVLVGPAEAVQTVKGEVEDADEQMCRVLNIDYPRTAAMITAVYHPKGLPAATLLGAVTFSQSSNTVSQGGGGGSSAGGSNASGLTHARVGTVDLYATPLNSVSAQAISLSGRETEVNHLLAAMESIDTALSQGYGDYVMYNVKYADPRALREELIVQFPALSVNIPPASAGNPNSYKGDIQEQASQRGNPSNGASSNNGAPSTQAPGTVTYGPDTGADQGLASPFKDAEGLTVPMRLMIRGNHDMLTNALTYLAAVDIAPRQVALDLRVMELTKEDAQRIGLDWSILTGGTVQSLHINQGLGDTSSTPGTASSVLGFHGGAVANILATLDEIGTKNHLIARPNLLALDGRQSEIFVGDVIRYIQSIQATQNGTTVTTGEVPVGVRLAVLPRIGSDGHITMDLRPVVSQLNGFTPVPGGGELPQTSLRIAQSTMLINDGETIALGGLIQDNDLKTRSGIPILKDLPILSWIFGRTNNDHKRTEIVFFLTAHVVDGDRANAANPLAHPDHNNEGRGNK